MKKSPPGEKMRHIVQHILRVGLQLFYFFFVEDLLVVFLVEPQAPPFDLQAMAPSFLIDLSYH
jgi:hypothetical protein